MENRELGLVEIFTRIKTYKTALGLVSFKRSPTTPVSDTNLPCIFMVEDVDEIVKHSSRDEFGYPAQRELEVVLEIITADTVDIKSLYNKVRKVVFTGGSTVADNTIIRELRTEGPTGYGLSGVFGMRLVLAMTYIDKGFVDVVL